MVVIEAETVATLLHQMDISTLANTNQVRDMTGRAADYGGVITARRNGCICYTRRMWLPTSTSILSLGFKRIDHGSGISYTEALDKEYKWASIPVMWYAHPNLNLCMCVVSL